MTNLESIIYSVGLAGNKMCREALGTPVVP